MGAPRKYSQELQERATRMAVRKVSRRVRQFPSGGLYEGLL